MSTSQSYHEKDLLQRLAEGDANATQELFESYFPRLYYFAYKLVAEDAEAEDIAQESLLSLWQRRESFAGRTLKEAEAFMFTVARNRCYNYNRDKTTRNNKLSELGGAMELTDDSVETAIIREDIFNRIFEEIEQLGPGQVQLLKMIFVDHLETAEIAERLQITPNNVRNQKARALEKLKTVLLRKRLLTPLILFFYYFL